MMKRISSAIAVATRAVVAAFPALLRDLIGLSAIGLIGYGAWLISQPAGYITVGGLLLIGSVLHAMKG